MLKYISEILTKFTPQQRVIALLLLLVSIVLMTNGEKLIKSIKGVPDDIQLTINTQKIQIKTLQEETKNLNLKLINGQRECTNKLIDREKEFAVEIQKIIDLARRTNSHQLIVLDTLNLEGQVKSNNTNLDLIINQLGKLKSSLSDTPKK